MQAEEAYIIEQFETHFAAVKDKNIVLYGIGKNTKLILEHFSDYNIVALMDPKEEGNTVYGQKVISKNQAIALNPIIIIVARVAVVDIIYKRIADLSERYGIRIYDIQGNQPKGGEDFKVPGDAYFSLAFSDLRARALASDILSFDIFDTLIARKIYEPEHIFKIVENVLLSQNIRLDFYKNRIEAAKKCAKYASIDDIYKKFSEKMGNGAGAEIDRIQKLELDTEKKFLYPRRNIVSLLPILKRAGKKIFLLSDMYYPAGTLKDILTGLGIKEYDRIFVSCEEKAEKEDGSLYQKYLQYLKEQNLSGKLLHIGDNRLADIQMAERCRIPAFYYLSGNELLLKSAVRSLLSQADSIFSQVSIGLIKKRLFDDPFSLSETKGIPQIHQWEDIGYLVFGSVIMNFMLFFIKKIVSQGIDLVLCPSRDGYLISEIYKKMALKFPFLPKCVYFRASRRAGRFMNLKDRDDIRAVLNSEVSGDWRKALEYQLNIKIPESFSTGEEISAFVLAQADHILRRAAEQKKYYMDYLTGLGITNGRRIAIFDFVAKGSVQYYLSQILNRRLDGYYFATMNFSEKWDKYEFLKNNIDTLYGNITSYESWSEFAKNYLLLETILQDDKGTFFEIDQSQNISFSAARDRLEVEYISQIQAGIIEFAEDFMELADIFHIDGDNRFADEVLKYMKYCVKNNDLKALTADDEYNGIGGYGIWGK